VLIALLLVYANGDAWRAIHCRGAVSTSTNLVHVGMIGLSLAWARRDGVDAAALGLGRAGLGRGLVAGGAVGVLGGVLIRLFFAFPWVSRRAVAQPEFEGLSRGRLLWLLGGQFLLGSALFEEVAFRGLLQAKLLRLLAPVPAVLVASVVFAAWHLMITAYNLRRSNLPRALFAPLYLGALTALGIGGALFGLLRLASGHLAAPVAAHWLMIASLVMAVARPRRPAAP
jgi:membrane protease YdiL (CAAX protease family)